VLMTSLKAQSLTLARFLTGLGLRLIPQGILSARD